MAYRSISVPLAVLIWAATAIIQVAHATEQQPAKIANLHHHHHLARSCAAKSHKPCSRKHRVRHSIGHHGSWYITDDADLPTGPMISVAQAAEAYEGLSEHRDRATLTQLFADQLGLRINPQHTAWCAAFANAILVQTGHAFSGSIETTSFLGYGQPVEVPAQGDIVVIKGASRRSLTHVGFLVGSAMVNGRLYYKVLGGNQSNSVRISMFAASKVIAIRRAT